MYTLAPDTCFGYVNFTGQKCISVDEHQLDHDNEKLILKILVLLIINVYPITVITEWHWCDHNFMSIIPHHDKCGAMFLCGLANEPRFDVMTDDYNGQ